MSLDNDGTPLGKANQIAYSDNTKVQDDRIKVSQGDSYAEGSGFTDDPTYVKKKPTLIQRLKNTYSTTTGNAKKAMTYDNVKRIGSNLASHATSNLKEDVGYLGEQTKSSMKTFGLTKKQSNKRYGKERAPPLLQGEGGFADTIFPREVSVKQKNKQKQNNVFNNTNNVTIKNKKNKSKLKKPENSGPLDFMSHTSNIFESKQLRRKKDNNNMFNNKGRLF